MCESTREKSKSLSFGSFTTRHCVFSSPGATEKEKVSDIGDGPDDLPPQPARRTRDPSARMVRFMEASEDIDSVSPPPCNVNGRSRHRCDRRRKSACPADIVRNPA